MILDLAHKCVGWMMVLGTINLVGCSSSDKPNLRGIEYYKVPSMRHPNPPRYGTTMWSLHPSNLGIGNSDSQVCEKNCSPVIGPEFSFEMPDSTLGECVQALAQAMGFRWKYPPEVSNRKVSINMVGDSNTILSEISKRAGVYGSIDYSKRTVIVTTSVSKGNKTVTGMVGSTKGIELEPIR